MILDTAAYTLEHGGRTVRLRPSGAALLERMALAFPRAARRDSLISALWPDPGTEPENPEASVRVQVSHLRRVAGQVGLVIGSHWGVGYRISEAVGLADGAPVKVPAAAARDIVRMAEATTDRPLGDMILNRLGIA